MQRITWHIGDVVRKLRTLKGLTAADLKIRANTLGDFEKMAGDPSYDFRHTTLVKITKALKLSAQELYALVPVQPSDVTSPVTPVLDDAEQHLLNRYRLLSEADRRIVDGLVELVSRPQSGEHARPTDARAPNHGTQ